MSEESRSVEALRNAVAGQAPSRVQRGLVYLIDADVIDSLLDIRFQCPACGGSFKVSSAESQRIYCGPCARANTDPVSRPSPSPDPEGEQR